MSPAPFRFPRSIATVSLAGTLPEKLEAAGSVGFNGIELFENDLLTFDGAPAEVRRIGRELGLAITAFQPFRDFEAMPDPERARNFERAERKFDVMQALGTDLILVCSNVHPAAIDDPARAAADLRALAERAARHGMRVAYEALAWGRHVRRWSQAWQIVRDADHPALGLVLDSFHTLALKDDFAGIPALPAEKLFFVQLADAPLMTGDLLSWSRHFRNFPGQGDLDVVGFLRAVLASGYQGPLSLEVFNDEFRAAPARLTARDGLRSLIFAEAEAGGRGLPNPPVFNGVEFVEFAIDAATREELAAFLGHLGFRRAGRHRSKAVELFRQGQINLLLNSEPDSAASYHFQLHGPSVCALALRVDDVERALNRAQELKCSLWQEPIGAGERTLPAVRAPDGMLINLIEPDSSGRTIYDDDFHLTPEPGNEAGLVAIDHIAQALPVGRMEAAVLFWRAVFGFAPQPLWEIPDPYGLVRSRAMVSRDGSTRLPLNISEGRETATGRFVSASAGAGVHHLAFATEDIERALESMSGHNDWILPIPPNYYDDLAAKYGLMENFLGSLRKLNLLYERDDDGLFRHVYTDSLADRFFFEIVERRGYRGFGAINAAVRMAAQAQRRSGGDLVARMRVALL